MVTVTYWRFCMQWHVPNNFSYWYAVPITAASRILSIAFGESRADVRLIKAAFKRQLEERTVRAVWDGATCGVLVSFELFLPIFENLRPLITTRWSICLRNLGSESRGH